MMIEITIKEKVKEMNIAVNDKQTVRDCMRILAENHAVTFTDPNEVRIHSVRKQEYIDPESDFRGAGIYNGDVLHLYTDKGESYDDTGYEG